MPLFQKKILDRSLNEITKFAIPGDHKIILEEWANNITSRSIYSQSEVSLHGHFIQKILIDVLGYTGFGSSESWSLQREQPIGKGSVDVALGHFTESNAQIIAPFELKGAKTCDLDAIMSGRHKSPVQQAWEYAMDAPGAQWVLLSNYVEIRLYAVGYGRQDYEIWQFEELLDPQEYARFILLLSAENLLGTETRSLLAASDKAEKDITNRLYGDYRTLRLTLIRALQKDNPDIVVERIVSHAQTLLDRILFIAFAEDRGLLPELTLERAFQHSDHYNPKPIWENFKGLFRAIDQGNAALDIPPYNGGLFAHDPELDALLINDQLCESFKALGEYDFESEVGVTVLGHIFEQSISDLEEIHDCIEAGENPLAQEKEKQTAVKGKRKQHGVVYTPDNITRFIVEQTLGSYLQKEFDQLILKFITTKKLPENDKEISWKSQKAERDFWGHWRDRLMQIKIVDPACGSGAFLVAAFDYLHAEYSRINDKLAELTGSRDFFDLDKEILNRNLYGVDLNAESIEITKLSLWLKTARRGKPLESLDANLRHGNSIVNDQKWDDHAFDWQQAFPDVFAEGGFDVVIGNPPYVRQERFSPIKSWLEQNYTVYHGVADLYCYFFELGVRLLKPEGQLGYISSSTFFKTGSGENLRQYLSDQTTLKTIVDFGDLQLFEGVTTYPAILVAQKSLPPENTIIDFLALTDQLPDDLNAHYQQHRGEMQQQQLGPSCHPGSRGTSTSLCVGATSWRLEDKNIAELRQRISHGKATLKDVYGSPLYGIKTGFNEAFVIDRATRDRLISDDPESADILKPFLEGKDLKKWHVQPRDLSLILFPRGWTREQSGLEDEEKAWNWLQQNYPAISRWLEPYSERGKKRGDKGEFWWELRACAYYDQFEKPKIFYPDISQGAKFSFDNSGMLTVNTVYFLSGADYFLLSFLNSKAYWFYLKGISDAFRGGQWRIRMFSEKIETLPIPNATDQQKQTLASLAENCQQQAEQRYQIEHAVRRRLPDLCPAERDAKLSKKLQNWWQLDFPNFRAEIKNQFKQDIPLADRNDWEQWLETERETIKQLSNELDRNEQQLNALVYELFELDENDIALLEANL